MLRRKVIRQIIIIELAILCLFSIGYVTVYGSYIRLENEGISTNINRIKSALDRELEKLETFNTSWAKSGILYYSISNEEPGRILLRNMLVNYIVGVFSVDRSAISDKEGMLRIARELVAEGSVETDISSDHSGYQDFQRILKINNDSNTKSTLGFFVDSENSIRLVSAEPITSLISPGASFGTLVSSSRIDTDALAEVVLQEVNIQTISDFAKSNNGKNILELLNASPNTFVNIPNQSNKIDSFSYLQDIQGKNSLVLSIHSDRNVITQAKEAFLAASLALLALFMFLAAYIVVFLDNKILRRLKNLSGDMTDLSTRNQIGKTLPVVGNDEISNLTLAFNRVLVSLERSHKDMKQEKDKAETTLGSIGEAVIATDVEGNVQYLNKTAEALTNSKSEQCIGKNLKEIFDPRDDDGNSDELNLVEICVGEQATVHRKKYNHLHTTSGKEITIESEANPIFDHDNKINGAVIVFRDVSEAKTLQQNLVYQASHDSLTGLFNRAEFEKKLDEIVQGPAAENHQNHLLFIDLDRFKIVNDSCGHLAGDKVLRELSALMKSLIRQSDIIARIGGDEFGVILHNCPFDKAFDVAEKLRKKVAEFRFFSNEKSFSFGASIGLINLEDHIYDADAGVLSLADKACMAAKNAGRNRVHVFKSTDAHVAEHQNQTLWVNRITDALEHNQFTLYFQKILPAEQNLSGKVKVEVLLRMLDKTGAIVAPGVFLPAAERYGLMQLIDKWVIENFFQWHIENAQALQEFESFSINLSGQSLSDEEFLSYLIDFATSSQVDAKSICFEITETAAIQNITNTLDTFTKMREKGFSFALDDFGSGMSSFNYLKHLPIDSLKIDGIFIRNIDNQPFDYSMVRSINELAHLMSISTTAEFIETERVSALVSGLGVDYLQGYHLHRPEPLSVLVEEKELRRSAQ